MGPRFELVVVILVNGHVTLPVARVEAFFLCVWKGRHLLCFSDVSVFSNFPPSVYIVL